MKETIGIIILGLLAGLIAYFFIFRPLIAIGDIPNEIKELRESVDRLSNTIKNRMKEGE